VDFAANANLISQIYILVLDEDGPLKKFSIVISTDDYNETQDGLTCKLLFTFPEVILSIWLRVQKRKYCLTTQKQKYPDEEVKISLDEENFEKDIKAKLQAEFETLIKENVGMEICFLLVNGAQEILNTLFDEIKNNREELELQKLRQHEEAERKRFEGTKVTIATFMKWRQDFEEEMGITERKQKELDANRKPTGKELFLRDQSLLDSDIRFLQQAGDKIENVTIDESLFQDLMLDEELPSDDDDDDSDDEDYVPPN